MSVRLTRELAIGAALFALALCVRSLLYLRVLGSGGWVGPRGEDEYYHMQRIWYSVNEFPAVLERDPSVNYPHGAEVVWPPGFDWCVAALARFTVGPDQPTVESLAAWLPPVLGALLVVVAAAVAQRTFRSTGAGVVAGGLLAVLPAHVAHSQLGMVDHHVAVALLGTALLGICLGIPRGADTAGSWRAHLATGVGAALFLLVWAGALLQLLVLQACALVWAIGAADAELARRRALRMAAGAGATALLLAPHALGRSWAEFGGWSPLVLCSFQPVWFAAVALGLLVLATAWSRVPLGAMAGRRLASALALAGLAALVLIALVPPLGESLDTAAGWFRKDEAFQLRVNELRPLFAPIEPGELGPFGRLSWLLAVFPLALAWLAVTAARARAADRWLLFAWCAAFGGLTLLQVRFENTFTPAFAIVSGGAFVALAHALRPRAGQLVSRLALCGAVALALAPLFPYYRAVASLAVDREATVVSARDARRRAHVAAALWLRDHAPAVGEPFDLDSVPAYGVLTEWSMGHLVRYVSGRALVQDNFGVYAGSEGLEAARAYFSAETEAQAIDVLEALRVRYVVSSPAGSGLTGPDQEPMRLALQRRQVRRPLPLLSRHRVVYEASDFPFAGPVRVYELVPGARIEGRAAPGTLVQARIRVEPRGGSAFLHDARVVADETGHYQLRVPYPSGAQGLVSTEPHYTLVSGGEVFEFDVPDAAVTEGTAVGGPDFATLDVRLEETQFAE